MQGLFPFDANSCPYPTPWEREISSIPNQERQRTVKGESLALKMGANEPSNGDAIRTGGRTTKRKKGRKDR
jgi:hypothetical protein